jgi:hypothetical protein
MPAALVLTMTPPEAGQKLTVTGTGFDGTGFAALTTVLAGANNDLVYTAKAAGFGGNAITVAYVDPGGVSATLGVVVTGNAIVVNLGRAASAINSTAAAVAAAIAASVPANALVSVANSGADNGTGLVTALAATHLAGASDAANVDVEIHGPDEEFIIDEEVATDGSGNFTMPDSIEIEHEGIIKATAKRHADHVLLASASLEVFRR